MKTKSRKKEAKGKLTRREFLKAGAAGLGIAAMGTFPRQVFGAPAVIKGTKLSILQGTYFIAPAPGPLQETGPGMGAGQRGHHGCSTS